MKKNRTGLQRQRFVKAVYVTPGLACPRSPPPETNEKGQQVFSTLRIHFLLFQGLAAIGLKLAVCTLHNCSAQLPSPHLQFQSQAQKSVYCGSSATSALCIDHSAVGVTLAEAQSLLQQGKEKERNYWQHGPLLLAGLCSHSNTL